MMVGAGFPEESSFEITIPDVATFPEDQYAQFLKGDVQAPLHGRGGWFVFGSQKK